VQSAVAELSRRRPANGAVAAQGALQ
jgi:hypothetical protein